MLLLGWMPLQGSKWLIAKLAEKPCLIGDNKVIVMDIDISMLHVVRDWCLILRIWLFCVVDLIFPERRKLVILPPMPPIDPGRRPPKMFKRLIDLRGPELIHNKLIYKMYGIRVCSAYYLPTLSWNRSSVYPCDILIIIEYTACWSTKSRGV